MPIADARDIIVTTPKNQIAAAAEEAKFVIKSGGGYYFRRLSSRPKNIRRKSRVFYVEDGYIRGFCIVRELEDLPEGSTCKVTWKKWAPGFYVYMDADSWEWIDPIPMKGFQGFRYAGGIKFEVVGNWLDPKPEVKENV